MRYTVVWRETALGQLARIWVESDNRNGINETVDAIDAELLNDPDQRGDDYYGDRYVTFPLMWALYRVSPDDRTVHILQVGRPGLDLPHENLPAVDE
jgi:hypothetical protein